MIHRISGPLHRFERPFQPMVRLFGACFAGSTVFFLPLLLIFSGEDQSAFEQFFATTIVFMTFLAGIYMIVGSEVATINIRTRKVESWYHVPWFKLPVCQRGLARLVGEVRVARETMRSAEWAHRVSYRWVILIPREEGHRPIRFLNFPDPETAEAVATKVAKLLELEFDPNSITR
ncbi:MAG: hypothetical protein JJU11_10230 [Candidatus Sumerlaeia bacterium]|nr:hypothetical protein [Candidatus Sumerlaeia bacterium]